MKTVADLVERLRVHHRQTADTPLFNPVFQLSLDLSRDLESGALTIDGLGAMVAELECSGLKSRADRLEALVEPDKADATIATLVAEEDDFDAFAERWSRPQLHAVFTAHPTFLLAPAQSNAIAAAASDRDGSDDAVCAVSGERPALTLDYEHGEAMRAIVHAQDARDRIVERIFEQAQARWPDRWRELAPVPFRFATWVGYDMDGRTDIKWHTSIAYRLAEKARRLGRYADCLEGIAPGHQLVDQLRRAAAHAGRHATEFEADLSDPAALAAAANGLTSDHPDKLLTLAPVIAQIEAEAEAGPQAVAFRTLAAAMRADGLGMGWIHFRVNASQLHNAIRRRLPEGHAIEIASRGALATLRAMLAEVRPLRANFAALAVESSTAIRQFISMAQILHHVDADTPIRMLIAECEQPATVLAALYFAELFGVADKVDVSPLFETESALEHGGRLLDALLAEPAYQAYARRRGRVAVQTGFSDAGRFVGQIPASLAIERLQGRLAAARNHEAGARMNHGALHVVGLLDGRDGDPVLAGDGGCRPENTLIDAPSAGGIYEALVFRAAPVGDGRRLRLTEPLLRQEAAAKRAIGQKLHAAPEAYC